MSNLLYPRLHQCSLIINDRLTLEAGLILHYSRLSRIDSTAKLCTRTISKSQKISRQSLSGFMELDVEIPKDHCSMLLVEPQQYQLVTEKSTRKPPLLTVKKSSTSQHLLWSSSILGLIIRDSIFNMMLKSSAWLSQIKQEILLQQESYQKHPRYMFGTVETWITMPS